MSNAIPMPQPSPFVRLVAENVRAECARRDWMQADVARVLNTSRTAVNNRWRGRMQWQLEDLEQLAAAMEIPVTRFFARSEGFEPPTFWLEVTEDPDLTGADAEHSAEVYDFATGLRVA